MGSYADMLQRDYADDCLAAIGLRPAQKVMDFGCGNGGHSIPVSRIVGKQGKVYAMDKNPETLTNLQRLTSSQGLTNKEVVNLPEAVPIPLEDGSLDVVLLHDVLYQIGRRESRGQTTGSATAMDRRRLLQELSRVMKWDGLLSVFCPHLFTGASSTSETDLRREIESAGFQLVKEMYRPLIYTSLLQQGHLYSFRKRRRGRPALEPFVYASPSFRAQLAQNAHHYGEVTLLEAMAEPAMVVLELGANRGVTAVALAKGVGSQGQVHAFEPLPDYYAALTENLRLNGVHNVRMHQFAVTDKEGESRYYMHGEGSGIVPVKDARKIMVGTTSLDNFMAKEALERVDLINMDCEGAELLALQGGKETLRQHAPRILCEIHHAYLSQLGQSVHDIVEYLRGLGFEVAPVSVEAFDEDVGFEGCTHVCAVANGKLPDTKRMGRRQETNESRGTSTQPSRC